MSRLSLGNEESTTAERGGEELPLRFVTAASLFDGHDAAINVMRRLIQDSGAEVVHLGHNRAVADVVRAAIQEDADGIAAREEYGVERISHPNDGMHLGLTGMIDDLVQRTRSGRHASIVPEPGVA